MRKVSPSSARRSSNKKLLAPGGGQASSVRVADGLGELHRLSIFIHILPSSTQRISNVPVLISFRCLLTHRAECRYRRCMSHSYLSFDFGKNEETAQQARHKVEGWKQGFRLGNKITIKFEREEPDSSDSVAKEDSPDEDTADSSPKQSEATGKRKHDGRGKHDAGTKKVSAKASKNEDSDISVRVL